MKVEGHLLNHAKPQRFVAVHRTEQRRHWNCLDVAASFSFTHPLCFEWKNNNKKVNSNKNGSKWMSNRGCFDSENGTVGVALCRITREQVWMNQKIDVLFYSLNLKAVEMRADLFIWRKMRTATIVQKSYKIYLNKFIRVN
ncbi:hypothetical protein TNCT_237041 [Trichonephila clavata]|uniref:Uncharacterized protein n=1 Tax=Trichonephila clavata TaxID=2740835 RepID=A0A8X6KIJ6_TRICU|nr:hypothetical protein TNCT_237041 [Trichonephila clavata]